MQFQSTLQDPVTESIYMFVNSVSGGQSGKRFIDLQIQTVHFTFDQNHIRLSFYDLLNENSKLKGLSKIKMESSPVKVIVCGGDGTILWVVEEMVKTGIDTSRITIGIVPLGTGNDFSRATGWGAEQSIMIGKKLQKLKALVKEWLKADVVEFDIWEAEVSVRENGFFKKGSKGSSTILQHKVIKRCFSNYCSLGVDGRIGYAFDKLRSGSRLINMTLYGGICLQKSFKPCAPMNGMIERIYVRKTISDQKQTIPNKDSSGFYKQPRGKESHMKLIPCTDPINSFGQQQMRRKQLDPDEIFELKRVRDDVQRKLNSFNEKEDQYLQSSQKSHLQNQHRESAAKSAIHNNGQSVVTLDTSLLNICALNIESYMGGVTNIWSKAQSASKQQQNQESVPSRYDDGIIQIVGWKGETSLALERLFSMAYKVAQGEGPFHFEFKEQKRDFHTYLQVDGQFWKVVNPKELIIRKTNSIPGSRIKVLRRNI